MAETTEREYVIPLRREFLKVPAYRRAGRAAKAIKKFIAKHMKIPERDLEKVKIDIYLNNKIWFRGKANPPSKIKVRARREGEIVKVELVETPEHVKFLMAKHSRAHKSAEKKEEKAEVKPEEKKEEKIEEKEKEKSVEESQIKEAKKEKLADKHVTKVKQAEIKRTALNRH
ncbi:MAG TPA: 50S ribosomal protein L31e [Candidatus Nanoarchaeia archaeon]|nr:50S ribosomal protein L31e [Candidatus Nanoarchaeia archaeon]